MAGWVVFSALSEKAAVPIRCPAAQSHPLHQVPYQRILEPDLGQINVLILAWTAIAEAAELPQTNALARFKT
jgi:hypothetical protein